MPAPPSANARGTARTQHKPQLGENTLAARDRFEPKVNDLRLDPDSFAATSVPTPLGPPLPKRPHPAAGSIRALCPRDRREHRLPLTSGERGVHDPRRLRQLNRHRLRRSAGSRTSSSTSKPAWPWERSTTVSAMSGRRWQPSSGSRTATTRAGSASSCDGPARSTHRRGGRCGRAPSQRPRGLPARELLPVRRNELARWHLRPRASGPDLARAPRLLRPLRRARRPTGRAP